MIDLVKLFAPVATPHASMPNISRVGIDVQGTLLKHIGNDDYEVDRELQEFYLFLQTNKASAEIISTEPRWATKSLVKFGADYRTYNVIKKSDYFGYLTKQGQFYAAIDDNIPPTTRAAFVIHPQDPKFREFLRTREYERTLTFK